MIRLARVLLDEQSSAEELRKAAVALYDLLCDGREFRSPPTAMPTGVAISPADAASCARDAPRTAVFLRGVFDAIREARQRHPMERLNVVYAGTGPLGALVVPLLPFLSPDDIRVAFIDIHAEAIEWLAAILRRFGLEEFAIELRVGDAATYRASFPVHIAIAETMQRALTVEAQVAVMRNLEGQLVPGGIAIPERITLNLGFADPAALFTSPIVPLGVVDDLSAEAVFRLPVLPRHYRAVCTADIAVFGRHRLHALESGLTYPEVFWDLGADGQQVAFRYEEGARPGMRWRLTQDSAAEPHTP